MHPARLWLDSREALAREMANSSPPVAQSPKEQSRREFSRPLQLTESHSTLMLGSAKEFVVSTML